MKHSMRLFFCVIVLSAFFFGACSNGVDSMVENYNGNFSTEKAAVSEGVSVYDEGFSEDDLLADEYKVEYDYTLIIPAPKDGKSYRWTLAYGEGGKNPYVDSFLQTGRTLIAYIPDDTVLNKGEKYTWTRYALTLVVTAVVDGVEKQYSDTASLYIYY